METQLATSPPVNGTFANAKVSTSLAPAVPTPIVPLPANEALAFLGVKPDIKDMTLDEKFACLKQCFSYGYGVRKVLCEVFEAIRAEFKTYTKDRAGMPTVEEAFRQRGLNYHTVYSTIEREKVRCAQDAMFFAEIKAKAFTTNRNGIETDLPPVSEPVVVEDGRRAVVLRHCETDTGSKTAEVLYEDDGTSEIKKAESLVTVAEVKAAKAAARAARKSEGGGIVRTEKRKNRGAPADSFEQIRTLALRMLTEGFKVLKPTGNPSHLDAAKTWAKDTLERAE